MESLKKKMNCLNIKPIDDEVYLSKIKDLELVGEDMSKWKYYKRYGNEMMLYSDSYLENKTLEELKAIDKKNRDMFGLTLKGKIRRWIDVLWFSLWPRIKL